MKIGAAVLAWVLLGAGSAPAADEVDLPGWMAGAWATQAAGRWTEEYWTPPRGGIMIGAGITGQGDAADFFEHMRIMAGPDRRLAFFGMPRGAPAVAFRLVRSGSSEAVFENPTHDYPQRIAYRREREMLVATVSMIDGSRAETWWYKRRR